MVTLELGKDMAPNKTAEEARNEYISLMGEDLGRVFYALWQEVVWLYTGWGKYVDLFGTKPSRIDLTNKSAPEFAAQLIEFTKSYKLFIATIWLIFCTPFPSIHLLREVKICRMLGYRSERSFVDIKRLGMS